MGAKVLLLISAVSQIQAESVKQSHTPVDAVQWALLDQLILPEEDRKFFRYIWIPPTAGEDAKYWIGAISYALNSISTSRILHQPAILANGWLLRFDLRRLAPEPEEFTRLQRTWDSCAVIEPYFHISQEILDAEFPVPIAASWINESHVAALARINFSPALVYRADWFLIQLLSSAEGKYYQFAQIPKGNEDLTDQQAFFRSLALNEQEARNAGGDLRAVLLRSGVTGKPRRVDRYHGLVGAVWITRDITDEDRSTANNPFFKLFKFNDSAREVIAERPNGLHIYALFDDRGKLVSSVPDNVAIDWTIPDGNTKRLEAGLSCISCHGTSEGLMEVPSDLQTILNEGYIDLIGDFNPDVVTSQPLDRLVQLYARGLDKQLRRGRDDLNEAIMRSTSQIEGGMSAKVTMGYVAKIRNGYKYPSVSPQEISLDLGFPDKAPKEILGEGITNPLLAAVAAELPITRQQWEMVYHDAMAKRFENFPIEIVNTDSDSVGINK